MLSDSTPVENGTDEIVKAWRDSEGSDWYQTFDIVTSGPTKNSIPRFEMLQKISKSGTVLEYMWSGVTEFSITSLPTKIDPKDTLRYRIYYRSAK